MLIRLDIVTDDKGLLYDILGKDSSELGDTIKIPGEAEITFNGYDSNKAVGSADVLHFFLEIVPGVVASLIAAWLYDKVNNRASQVNINRREVIIKEKEIERIIEETIQFERKE